VGQENYKHIELRSVHTTDKPLTENIVTK